MSVSWADNNNYFGNNFVPINLSSHTPTAQAIANEVKKVYHGPYCGRLDPINMTTPQVTKYPIAKEITTNSNRLISIMNSLQK